MSKNLDGLAGAVAREAAGLQRPGDRQPQRRMRNYAAMGDDNLVKAHAELLSQGDALERCLATGSGEPARDLERVRQLMDERGLAR